MKEGRDVFWRSFQQLKSYRDEIETRNWEEITLSSQIVQRGLLVTEEPGTAFLNATRLHSDQANHKCLPQAEIKEAEVLLGLLIPRHVSPHPHAQYTGSLYL